MQKKLERATWPGPMNEDTDREINFVQLEMLLSSIDFWRANEELHYAETDVDWEKLLP